jgi:hypothetical protein
MGGVIFPHHHHPPCARHWHPQPRTTLTARGYRVCATDYVRPRNEMHAEACWERRGITLFRPNEMRRIELRATTTTTTTTMTTVELFRNTNANAQYCVTDVNRYFIFYFFIPLSQCDSIKSDVLLFFSYYVVNVSLTRRSRDRVR